MSIAMMQKVWELPGMIASYKLVLMCLADAANDAGVCWPSIPTIARKCCTTERNTIRILSELEKNNFLQRDTKLGISTTYTLTPDTGVIPEAPDADVTRDIPVTPDTHVMPPLTPVSLTPDTHVTLILKNPKEPPRGRADAPTREGKKSGRKKSPKTNLRTAEGVGLIEGIGKDDMPDDWMLEALTLKPDKEAVWKEWDKFWRYYDPQNPDCRKPRHADWKRTWINWLDK